MKTNIKWTVRERLGEASTKYDQAVELLCLEVFNELVKPYCQKNNMTFTSGMGGWWFKNSEGEFLSDMDLGQGFKPDRELRRIIEILNIVPEHMPNNCLGGLMPNYP